jgi:hypothetical protein
MPPSPTPFSVGDYNRGYATALMTRLTFSTISPT